MPRHLCYRDFSGQFHGIAGDLDSKGRMKWKPTPNVTLVISGEGAFLTEQDSHSNHSDTLKAKLVAARNAIDNLLQENAPENIPFKRGNPFANPFGTPSVQGSG